MQNKKPHSKSGKKPVFSLILCSRSDEYQGNSRWRLQTALNYLGQSAFELHREKDIEVIVIDWGSKEPLSHLLKLTPEAARLVSFLYIPPEIATVEQKDSPFPEVIALNAAARRAHGEYIGRIDQDTLVGKNFLNMLFALYENRRLLVPFESALFLSNRRRVPLRFTAKSPSLWMVGKYVSWFARLFRLMDPLPPLLFYQSYVGIWLLHRDVWFECGGYDERFIYMDWQEVDMILRLSPKYTLINLGELTDHDLYHLDHGRPLELLWGMSRNRKENPVRNLENMPDTFFPNSKDWGLKKYKLEIKPATEFRKTATSYKEEPQQWLSFSLILLTSTLQIIADRLIVILWHPVRRQFSMSHQNWRRRFKTAKETISGAPLKRWPELLIAKWRENQ